MEISPTKGFLCSWKPTFGFGKRLGLVDKLSISG